LSEYSKQIAGPILELLTGNFGLIPTKQVFLECLIYYDLPDCQGAKALLIIFLN